MEDGTKFRCSTFPLVVNVRVAQLGSMPIIHSKSESHDSNHPAKKLNFPQICPKMPQNGPKMAKKWPNMTQNGPKWPKYDPK